MKGLLFLLLMALLIPVLLLGYLCYQVPILRQRGKVSGTAYEPFNARLLYHLVGARPDHTALQLAAGLPATNLGVMWLLVRPLAWAARLSGYEPAMLVYPPPRPTPMSAMVGARCEFLDKALLARVGECEQVVILGAGWDTRAYGMLRDKPLAIFEVDAPATQAVKRRALAVTGVDDAHVTFVTCDFNRQSWLETLQARGFDPTRRTFILWEGVTMYLDEAAIRRTLRAVATLPAGSCIAFDFLSREWLENTFLGKLARWAVGAYYAEPFTFGFPVQPEFAAALGQYLAEQGLSLAEGRPLGDEQVFGGLALAVNGSNRPVDVL